MFELWGGNTLGPQALSFVESSPYFRVSRYMYLEISLNISLQLYAGWFSHVSLVHTVTLCYQVPGLVSILLDSKCSLLCPYLMQCHCSTLDSKYVFIALPPPHAISLKAPWIVSTSDSEYLFCLPLRVLTIQVLLYILR